MTVISALLLACDGSPAASAGPRDTDRPECEAFLNAVSLEGERVFYRDPLVLDLAGDDVDTGNLLVERVEGEERTPVAGELASVPVSDTAVERAQWVFEPDGAGFQADSLYAVTLTFCDGFVRYDRSFRTSTVGDPMTPVDQLGTTWRLDFWGANWFSVGGPVDEDDGVDAVITLVDGEDEPTWRLGWAETYEATWSSCYQTGEMQTDWSENPWFEATILNHHVTGEVNTPEQNLLILSIRCALGTSPEVLEGCDLTLWGETDGIPCDEVPGGPDPYCGPCPAPYDDLDCGELGATDLPATPISTPLRVVTAAEATLCNQ